MRDWLDIGSSPPAEPCAQLGSSGYWSQALRECRTYIDLLRRTLGPEPTGARLDIRQNLHDFGTYLSVVCWFDTDLPDSESYAFRCEGEGPDEWDEIAQAKLNHERSNRHVD